MTTRRHELPSWTVPAIAGAIVISILQLVNHFSKPAAWALAVAAVVAGLFRIAILRLRKR